MKIKSTLSVDYDRPKVDVIKIDTTSVLCESSGQLNDLKKEEFDFNWGN